MLVTQKMIAAEVGIGQSWVSWVLRDDPRAKELSETKRNQILKIARERGYVPNTMASIMRSGENSRIVAMICGISHQDKFLFKTIAKINEYNFGVKVYTMENLEMVFNDIRSNKIPYIISYSVSEEQLLESVRLAQKYSLKMALNMPFVRFDDFPSFDSDNKAIVDTMVRHLAELGHERIVLFCDEHNSFVNSLRHDFFIEALEKRGLQKIKNPCLCEKYSDDNLIRFLRETSPSALCTINPSIAIRAMLCLGSIGVRVPQDISIITFGNNFMHCCTRPELSSVAEEEPDQRTEAIFSYFFGTREVKKKSDYSRFYPGILHVRGTTVSPNPKSRLKEKLLKITAKKGGGLSV